MSELYLLAGEAYYFKGDYQNAARSYDSYANQSKRKLPPDTKYKYAFAMYHTGNYETALNEFKTLGSRDEEVGQFASYYMGDIYLKQNNLNYAVSSFGKASQDDFNEEIKEAASFKYIKVQYDLGNYSQAIDGLEQFLSSYPNSAYHGEASDLLSEAYLGTSNYSQAVQHLEQIDNKSLRAQKAYQLVTYYNGTEFFNNSEYFKAVQMFEKSLKYPIDKEVVLLANYWSGEAYSIGKKYAEAIASYQAVIGDQGQAQHDKYVRTRYGLGYAYYNSQQYSKALEQFSLFLQEYKKDKKRFFDDALIRAADCHYVLKDYNSAIDKYSQAIERKSHDQDYAMLQKGTVLSIQGEGKQARSNFTSLINNFPKSRFADQAVYQRAQLDLEGAEYRQAVEGFTSLISGYQKSLLIPYAYSKRALAYYNLKEYDKTIADYSMVLEQHINHESSHDALIGLQETLNLLGRSGEFDRYFAMYKNANPGSSSLANIEYESAVNLYLNEDYPNAIEKFNSFTEAYPENNHVYEARFYIAESYYRSQQDEQAIPFYQTVVKENKISQVNRAKRRLGDLWFDQGNYQSAIESYLELEQSARTKKENYYAWSGLMESYFLEGNYPQVDHYASLIFDQGGVNTNAVNRSTLMRGKAAYMQNDPVTATDFFLSTLNSAQDENGAEAQYMLAKIQFDGGQHKQSNETLYDLNSRFGSQTYWIGKSFLLVTDNYIALEELFQARATLQSIIDNAPEQEIVEEAKSKLAQLQEEDQVAEDQDSVEFEVIEN
jgi:TolA-binding protein